MVIPRLGRADHEHAQLATKASFRGAGMSAEQMTQPCTMWHCAHCAHPPMHHHAVCTHRCTTLRTVRRKYEPLVAKNQDNLLGVTAIVLANQCVAYIMTSQVRVPKPAVHDGLQLACMRVPLV